MPSLNYASPGLDLAIDGSFVNADRGLRIPGGILEASTEGTIIRGVEGLKVIAPPLQPIPMFLFLYYR